jgi:hypothetical protein
MEPECIRKVYGSCTTGTIFLSRLGVPEADPPVAAVIWTVLKDFFESIFWIALPAPKEEPAEAGDELITVTATVLDEELVDSASNGSRQRGLVFPANPLRAYPNRLVKWL